MPKKAKWVPPTPEERLERYLATKAEMEARRAKLDEYSRGYNRIAPDHVMGHYADLGIRLAEESIKDGGPNPMTQTRLIIRLTRNGADEREAVYAFHKRYRELCDELFLEMLKP